MYLFECLWDFETPTNKDAYPIIFDIIQGLEIYPKILFKLIENRQQ